MVTIKQDSINEINKIVDVITQDFKLPLTSIAFNLQTIKRILSGEQSDDHKILLNKIECIERKTSQMSRVLEHLIDLNKALSNELPLKQNLIHTHDLVSDAVQMAREKPGTVHVVLENHQLNEYCTVVCDKDRLVQVFANIIHGLAELNPARTAIKLSTKIKGEAAQFFFKNESYTMDESVLKTIFDKFCVMNCNHKNQAPRISLGLALSKWIIEAHKGSLFIESKESLGTMFTIELPKMELDELKASLI